MNQRTATTTAGTVPEDGSPPAVGRALFDRASQAHRRGQPDEALELLDQLLADEPDNVAAQYARAICLADLGRTREATAQFRAVLARDPRHYEAAYQLGRTLQATADLTGAIDAYRAGPGSRQLPGYRSSTAGLREQPPGGRAWPLERLGAVRRPGGWPGPRGGADPASHPDRCPRRR
ncbi:tetratricopeptide repeat protein [Parafrankia sp. FMc6]|uniref:tetratricopeptide repeat protein n=1 Tax=Parafrankia soli TaxID=2599596 RepID=UPI0034D44D7F